MRSLNRLCQFQLARWQGDDLEVRRRMPAARRSARSTGCPRRSRPVTGRGRSTSSAHPTAEQRAQPGTPPGAEPARARGGHREHRALAAPLEVPPRPRPSGRRLGLGAPPPGRRSCRGPGRGRGRRSHPRLTAAATTPSFRAGLVRPPHAKPCPDRHRPAARVGRSALHRGRSRHTLGQSPELSRRHHASDDHGESGPQGSAGRHRGDRAADRRSGPCGRTPGRRRARPTAASPGDRCRAPTRGWSQARSSTPGPGSTPATTAS